MLDKSAPAPVGELVVRLKLDFGRSFPGLEFHHVGSQAKGCVGQGIGTMFCRADTPNTCM